MKTPGTAALLLLIALPARAELGLVAHDARVRAGERLAVEFEAAHGLTPPPGIQNERALRGFAARLCSSACVPLAALNVRPRDGWSLLYRVEFAVPAELAAGRYDLDVRFPGAQERAAGAIEIAAAPPAAHPPAVRAGGCSLTTPGQPTTWGLLLAAVSATLAAGRRRGARCGNSLR
jgi:hypothetical protein